jgi:hypothetical protein
MDPFYGMESGTNIENWSLESLLIPFGRGQSVLADNAEEFSRLYESCRSVACVADGGDLTKGCRAAP